MPVFEGAVGDVAAHDGVDDEEDEDGQVEPDELVQLPVEEAGPKKIFIGLFKSKKVEFTKKVSKEIHCQFW